MDDALICFDDVPDEAKALVGYSLAKYYDRRGNDREAAQLHGLNGEQKWSHSKRNMLEKIGPDRLMAFEALTDHTHPCSE